MVRNKMIGHFDKSCNVMQYHYRDDLLYDVDYDKGLGMRIGSYFTYKEIHYISPSDGNCFTNTLLMTCYPEPHEPTAAHALKDLLDSRSFDDGHGMDFIRRIADKAKIPVLSLKKYHDNLMLIKPDQVEEKVAVIEGVEVPMNLAILFIEEGDDGHIFLAAAKDRYKKVTSYRKML